MRKPREVLLKPKVLINRDKCVEVLLSGCEMPTVREPTPPGLLDTATLMVWELSAQALGDAFIEQ